MNKDLFRYYMLRHSDTQKTLANLLGCSAGAVCNKINCKGGDFTRKEIAILSEHWSLNGDEVKDIFLG